MLGGKLQVLRTQVQVHREQVGSEDKCRCSEHGCSWHRCRCTGAQGTGAGAWGGGGGEWEAERVRLEGEGAQSKEKASD